MNRFSARYVVFAICVVHWAFTFPASFVAADDPAPRAPEAKPREDVKPREEDAGRANRYPGFTGYTRPVTTQSAEAQQWFDQALQLLYGFNHDEAIRSFEKR